MASKIQFPVEFQMRLKNIVPPGIIAQVQRAYLEGPPITGRINSLKSSFPIVKKSLAAANIEIQAFEDIAQSFVVTKGNFKKLTETDAYEQGLIYLQSFSSQIPPLVLNPKPGQRLLDMCAAPGGKTTQLASLMQNQGEILACEPDQRRFERLNANIKRQGVDIVQTLKVDARKLNPERNGLFDQILLDAPCSSEGTFSLKEPSSFRHWSEAFVAESAVLQKKLIEVAWSLLKEGGSLVYSTCALSPEENEGVLDFALNLDPKPDLLDCPMKVSFLKPALTRWGGATFSTATAKARRIYPSNQMEGFFVALLTKK